MDRKSVEMKLMDYRARKAKEERFEYYKTKIKSIFSLRENKAKDVKEKDFAREESDECLLEKDEIETSTSDPEEEEDNLSFNCTLFNILYYALCFFFWAVLFAIFIEVGFGTVYVIISALIGMYLNTRTSKRSEKEVSAYSVFNKNCESIDGTLKAEQFEQEIRYGILR